MIIGIDGSRLAGQRTGTEFYSRHVIAALIDQARAAGHGVWVYVREPVSMAVLPDKVIHIQQRRLWTHIGLAREVAQRPPDALFIPAHVLPLPCAWRKQPRTIVTIHDVGYRHFPDAHPLLQRLYLELGTAFTARFADALIVDSQATQRDVAQFYGVATDKMTVAPLGLVPVPDVTAHEVRQVRAKFNLPADGPYILHIGTRQPRKNLRRLMEALAMMLSAGCEALGEMRPTLVLAGGAGWGGEDLPAQAQRLGIADWVRFTGYVSDVEKAVLLRGAAVYACPSLYEGFGLPVLEAQSVGVPVVCSNTSSLPEVSGAASAAGAASAGLPAGPGAILFDPEQVGEIVQALRRVLTNSTVCAQLVAAGYKNVARFSWERCAAQILAVIERQF